VLARLPKQNYAQASGGAFSQSKEFLILAKAVFHRPSLTSASKRAGSLLLTQCSDVCLCAHRGNP